MKQLSVVSKNNPGIIAEISQALANEDININNLVSEAIGDHAVTILTVDRYDDALKILKNIPEMSAVTEEAILVKLDDRPGALAELALRFKQAGISMRSIRIIGRGGDNSVVAISTERTEDALNLVKDLIIS